MAEHMMVAETILEQLGGRRFVVMTGAKSMVGFASEFGAGLMFKLPKAKDGINCVRVTLTPADTYRVEFKRLRAGTEKTVATREDVYCEELARTFTEVTGLYTSL